MRVRRILAIVVLALGIAVPFAAADPIAITSGSAVMGGGPGGHGSISLTGPDGFSFSGFLSSDGSFGPKLCSPCAGGTSFSLGGTFSGLDLSIAAVNFKGVTYTDVNGLLSPSGVSVFFAGGPLVAPPVTLDSVLLTAPVSLNGTFSLATSEQGPFTSGTFAGSGMAFVSLVRDAGLPTVWDYAGARYEFGSAAVVTPEPATLMLFGTGLLLVARRVRKRRLF